MLKKMGLHYERPVHQNGSCFVWKWWSGKNQNIIMFPKMGLFKTEKLGKIRNIQVFEILCLDRPEASPNNWKHRSGKDTEIQGPVRRETDLSPFRVVPAIDLNQLCTGVFLLLSSHGKIQISNLLRLFGPKKETRVMIMLWLPPQFSVERRKPQIFEND